MWTDYSWGRYNLHISDTSVFNTQSYVWTETSEDIPHRLPAVPYSLVLRFKLTHFDP